LIERRKTVGRDSKVVLQLIESMRLILGMQNMQSHWIFSTDIFRCQSMV
jgi:hypothetical protein